jgi:hypothetical protein
VTHRATARFWQCYERMPQEVRTTADMTNTRKQSDDANQQLQAIPQVSRLTCGVRQEQMFQE